MTWFWKQQIDFENGNNIKRNTGWISPKNIIQNSGDSATFVTGFKENLEQTKMTEKYDGSNYYDVEPKPIWNRIENIETPNDGTYSCILTPNPNPINKIYDTPTIICNGYDFNIPSGATITGIKVKLVKSSYSDYNNDTGNTSSNYTYDRIITLGTDETSYKNNAILIDNQNKQSTIWTNDGIPYSYLYGDENDLWYNDNSTPWTIDSINNNFSCLIGATQQIYKGSTTIPQFSSISNAKNWYKSLYSGTTITGLSFQVSKIYDIQVNVYYDIEVSGFTLYNREDNYNINNTLKLDNTYFKFQQCLNGICYSYIKNINDIYNISLMTSDGLSINNMYNEYNIIDEYIHNLYQVDIATNDQIDLSKNYYIIDNVNLKPNHLILINNQTSANTNDIYKVNNNYYLENSNLLSTRESSFRAKVYIKNGSHNQEQYFLQNVGNSFPITGETKYFITGHSYIVKNRINYDIFNTSTATTSTVSGNTSNPNKILFTDYSVARTLSETNDWKLNPIDISPTDFITIEYLNYNYTVSGTSRLEYSLSGGTSGHTILNISGHTTFVSNNTTFNNNSSIGDHIQILFNYNDDNTIPTGLTMDYFTKIKSLNNNILTIDSEIPGWIWNNIKNEYYFTVRNLHYCNNNCSDYEKYLNLSPYGEIIKFVDLGYNNLLRAEAKEKNNSIKSDFYRYFDFYLVSIISGDPLPFMNTPIDKVVCNNTPNVFVNFISNTPATYSWINNNITIGLPSTGIGNITGFTATNTGTTPTDATITVTPTFQSGIGSGKTFTLTVNPSGQINNCATVVTCNNSSTTIPDFTTTTGTGTTFYWENNNFGNGISLNGIGNIPIFDAINNSNESITSIITITPKYNNLCTGTPVQQQIIINPTAQINSISDKVYCSGTTYTIIFSTNNIDGATTYYWSNTNTNIGLASSGIGNITFSATNTSTLFDIFSQIIVTPYYTNNGHTNIGSETSFIITVKAKKIPNFSIHGPYCYGIVNDTLNTTSPNGIVGTWSPATINKYLSGSYTFTPTSPCYNTQTLNITINNPIVPIFSFPLVYCNGSLSNTILPSISDNGINGVWTPQPRNKYLSGTYTFTPISQGCYSTKTVDIIVLPVPSVITNNKVYVNNTSNIINFTSVNDAGNWNTIYNWTNDNINTGIAANGTGNIPFTSTNITTNIIFSTIYVTPIISYNGYYCTGKTEKFIVEIVPTPQVNQVSNITTGENSTVIIGAFSTINSATLNTGYKYSTPNTNIGLNPGTLSLNINGALSPSIAIFTTPISVTTQIVSTINVQPLIYYKGNYYYGGVMNYLIIINP